MTITTEPRTITPLLSRRTIPRLPIQGLLLGCLLAAGHSQAEESRLVVNLLGVRDATGNLRASLYREPDSFRKEDKAVKVATLPAAKGNARFVFTGLPAGRYAVMAYHDDNMDQKLNLRFGMFPTEGYGLSNNPKVIGPPKFSDSAFDLAGPETAIDIKLAY
ncbi:MAG: hypothetical protein CVU31_00690 [Betaproteobacteria bacterium HGW-Betaproteobacteria-4]|jgi:uncharacterized protein (DUF2141 family)|nr:MAG: hypothetical protein CVU31_00690 [Betaproteobacteria bacterium HGW-Betaproteobacteria-4]